MRGLPSIQSTLFFSSILLMWIFKPTNNRIEDVKQCPFCQVPDEKIIYSITPKHHIRNIKTLTVDDIPTLLEMERVANELIERDFKNQTVRLGFHVPPFYSIDHLHLHFLVEPFKPWKRIKYQPYLNSLWYKDFSRVLNDLQQQAV
ncbi:hypothetical protein CYY_002233 [Polysphondylium violaceum]|uniref:HIT domain-containing protein n=1 Tax=Polysphondylium violaceum TaxID=133409 RepID=A0A8J4PYG6_9MYCE|nr:hypothetical protein CYY_002233 [Polysphondylium violaceum]